MNNFSNTRRNVSKDACSVEGRLWQVVKITDPTDFGYYYRIYLYKRYVSIKHTIVKNKFFNKYVLSIIAVLANLGFFIISVPLVIIQFFELYFKGGRNFITNSNNLYGTRLFGWTNLGVIIMLLSLFLISIL